MSKSSASNGKSRNALGQYSKGVSGNPAGRPASPDEVRQAAGCYTVAAVAVLGTLIGDESQAISTRARAAQTLLRVGHREEPRWPHDAKPTHFVGSHYVGPDLEAECQAPPNGPASPPAWDAIDVRAKPEPPPNKVSNPSVR